MSVIPFILSGGNRTIVESKQEYQDEGGLDGNVILMQNFDRDQILDPNSSNASYDLRVGDEYRDHRESGKTDLLDNEKICLQAGSAVIIETAESVQFPKSRFGHIVPKVSLLQDGLSNTSSKIDPGYNGKLLVTVFNLGKRTVFLKKGQKFCTLYVLDIQNGVTPYNKVGKRIAGSSRVSPLRRAMDSIERGQALIACLALIVSIITGLAQIVEHIQKPEVKTQMPKKAKTY